MAQILRQSTQIIVRIGPAVAVGDGFTPVTSLSLSTADEAELLKANTTTTTSISGATMAAITGCDGWYGLTLTTSHTDTVGPLDVMINDDSLILPIFARFQVIEEAAYDAIYASSAAPATAAGVSAVETDTQDIQSRIPAALVGGRIDATVDGTGMEAGAVTAIQSGLATASALATAQADLDTITGSDGVTLATAQANYAPATAAALATAQADLDTLTGTDGVTLATSQPNYAPYTGTPPTAAAIADQVWEEAIADHSGTSGSTAEQLAAAGAAGDPWATAVPGAYGAGTAGKILGDNLNTTVSSRASQASLDTVDDLLDTEIGALTSELAKVPKSDGTVTWNATALGSIQSEATDALDAYDPPTRAELTTDTNSVLTAVGDVPTNAELSTALAAADDAVLAAIAALNNLSAAEVNAQVVDALATDTYAEPGQGTPGATVTLAAKIGYLYKAWRNKSTQTSTQYSLYNDDTTTIDHKATVSDDTTTLTKGEVATGP